ncbi:MAG: UDP-N-acetylmuramoyl-L-alanyl-D-glutamate--2,6-diaminopimelate ligase [bacterium]
MNFKFFKKLVPSFLYNWYHFTLSLLGALLYFFPGRQIKVIGITGTNGKSTVTHLATELLIAAGYKVASVSSIRFMIGDRDWPNTLKMTMPGRWKLQKFLRQAVDAGCQYVVLEVTSEGIKQHRHRFINLNTAVFTNLAPEHIESHGGFKKYREAKGKLFAATKKYHILNLDDENVDYFLRFPAQHKLLYTTRSQEQPREGELIEGKEAKEWFSGISFKVDNVDFNLQLMGRFNIYNALAVICIARSQGIDLKICKKVLEKAIGVPGRMEIVRGNPFAVIVDYAHTPDSLEKVYQSIKNFKSPAAKMICVLGSAGGGRDKWKRPEMGKIAARFCDKIVLADEDPYDEDPEQILDEVEAGIMNSHFPIIDLKRVLDRKKALKTAMGLATAGDVVIITGKGCEPWMCVANGEKIPWDDREFAKTAYNSLTDQ